MPLGTNYNINIDIPSKSTFNQDFAREFGNCSSLVAREKFEAFCRRLKREKNKTFSQVKKEFAADHGTSVRAVEILIDKFSPLYKSSTTLENEQTGQSVVENFGEAIEAVDLSHKENVVGSTPTPRTKQAALTEVESSIKAASLINKKGSNAKS